LGVVGFSKPGCMRAEELGITYRDQLVASEWLTTQAYNGSAFIELVHPVSGQSMFHDYLTHHRAGGTQHIRFSFAS
jgi:methylmalonyl-CoA/ethylmalonyl-CoA epimerase